MDDGCRTSIDHIYAIGDVIAKVALTPVAINEGHALADTLFGNKVSAPLRSSASKSPFQAPPLKELLGLSTKCPEPDESLLFPRTCHLPASKNELQADPNSRLQFPCPGPLRTA